MFLIVFSVQQSPILTLLKLLSKRSLLFILNRILSFSGKLFYFCYFTFRVRSSISIWEGGRIQIFKWWGKKKRIPGQRILVLNSINIGEGQVIYCFLYTYMAKLYLLLFSKKCDLAKFVKKNHLTEIYYGDGHLSWQKIISTVERPV